MIWFLLALMFLVVTGISTKSAMTWSSAFDSALTRDGTTAVIKSAEAWIL